jgi:CBS domain-containing protein
MSHGVVSCSPELSLREAVKLMSDAGVRALVVIDANCHLAGIVSQTDLVNATLEQPGEQRWDELAVRDVMTTNVLTVTPGTLLPDAAKLMVRHRVHRLVVVEGERAVCAPVGVLSMGDVIRRMAQ